MISKEDKEVFDNVMLGVLPLKNRNHKILKTSNNLLNNKPYKHTHNNTLEHNEYFDKIISGSSIIKYSGNIANTGIYNRLKKGQVQPEYTMDLHGFTVQEAQEKINSCLINTSNLSCIKIIHGKGLNNSDNKAVLKTFVANYLKNHQMVSAYHSCNKQQGSTGAILVLLKNNV